MSYLNRLSIPPSDAAGASAASGSGGNGGVAVAVYAGDADPGASGAYGGTGLITYGGNGPNYGGDGIDAFPGSHLVSLDTLMETLSLMAMYTATIPP